MRRSLLALLLFCGTIFSGTASAKIWFEDQFDRTELGSDWEIRNPDEEGYLVEDGVLTLLAADRTPARLNSSPNVLILKRPLPKGDWTMTIHFRFAPQTMSEEVWLGPARDAENGIFARFFLSTENYVRTNSWVQTRKHAKGKKTQFTHALFWIDSRNLKSRSGFWTNSIRAVELRLAKKGRKYEAAARLLPTKEAADKLKGEWIPTRKITSLRPLGDRLALFIASQGSDYIPKGGEALVEIDWLRIETP